MKLIEEVLSKENLNEAYKKVIRNKGTLRIDKTTCEEVKNYLKIYSDDIINQILSHKYEPLPVKRLEISKLGIPTVVDKIIQQALVQKLTPIFESTFSEYSYGFKSTRRCIDATDRAMELINQGYEWTIELEIEKLFDNVTQDKLVRIVDNVVKDNDITWLIHKYLKADVMVNGYFEKTEIGASQERNLSSLLGNIYLNEIDKELERRQLHFVRYVDCYTIFVKTKILASKVMNDIITFIENELNLKVYAKKTHTERPNNLNYLDFRFRKIRTSETIKFFEKGIEDYFSNKKN